MRTNIFPLILGFLLIIFNAENVKATITLGTNAGFVKHQWCRGTSRCIAFSN
jgi:hypothetical protein